MSLTVKHAFHSAKPDGADLTVVRPLDWNADHVITGGVPLYSDDETPGGAVDGVNTAFTLAHAPAPGGSLQVFLNGLLWQRGGDYTLAGAAITAISVPQTGGVLRAFYRY